MTVPQWLILAGAVGMCIDTVGWVLIWLDYLPEYPYFPIALGCFVVYFAGRVLRRREIRLSRREAPFAAEEAEALEDGGQEGGGPGDEATGT